MSRDLASDIVELVPCAAPAPDPRPALRETAFRADGWLLAETDRLVALFRADEPIDAIAGALGRRRAGIASRIQALGLRRHSPSIAMGRYSCSLKWKIAPQDAFLATWPPAIEAWARGDKVVRLIGYDCSPADDRRHAHASTIASDRYAMQYPLREWGWDRARCVARIEATGLAVPPKSSCFFCTGMTVAELRELPGWCLRLIVLVEARAAPRLRTVEGLWRSSTARRPGRMTDLIRAERGRFHHPERADRPRPLPGCRRDRAA